MGADMNATPSDEYRPANGFGIQSEAAQAKRQPTRYHAIDSKLSGGTMHIPAVVTTASRQDQ